MPFLFSFITTGYVARIVYAETRNQWLGFGLALLFTCTGWFYFSTGLLSYLDSFTMFALLVLAFSRSSWFIFAISAFAPWVDERYILTIPLMLAVRWLHFQKEDKSIKSLFQDTMIVSLGICPYLGTRLMALLYLEGDYQDYFRRILWHHYGHMFWGSIVGIKVWWLFLGYLIYYLFKTYSKVCALVITAILLLTIIQCMGIAYDYNRTIATVLPAGLLGALLWVEAARKWQVILVMALALGLQLLTPTHHYIWKRSLKIHNAVEAWSVYQTLNANNKVAE